MAAKIIEQEDKNEQKAQDKQKCDRYWFLIQTAAFFMWDGVGFFKMDDTKLNRLKGIPATPFDRCKSVRWIIFALVFVMCIAIIMYNEAIKLGTKKSQSITLVDIRK